jgi:hypothetical protein
MNLRKLLNNLEQIGKNEKLDLSKLLLVGDTTRGNYILKNINRFKKLLEAIQDVPLFQAEKEILSKSPIWNTTKDFIAVDPLEYGPSINAAFRISSGIGALIAALGETLPKVDEFTLAIKLPPLKTLSEAEAYLGDLDKVFSQNLLNTTIEGKVELKDWQPGSFWLEVWIGTAAAMALLAAMSWAAVTIVKKMREAQIFHEFSKSIAIKNETSEELKRAVSEQIDLMLHSESKRLAEVHFAKDQNNEQVERLRVGIKTFVELIDKGAEIHPALCAPEKVENLFPDVSKLLIPNNQTKLISDATNPAVKRDATP